MTTETYAVAGPGIYSEQFGDDLVVLNLNTGQYFGFNVHAGLIWKGLVDHQASMDGLCAAGFAREAVITCIARLEELGLVASAKHEPQVVPPDLVAGLDSAEPVPLVELYDDLASVILADPIHDTVSEAGWPNLPAKG